MLICAEATVRHMKVLGLVHVYNERDIIEDFLDHMAKQQVPLIMVDNGSTDGTYEMIIENRSNIVLRHAQLKAPKFELVVLLRLLHAMAVQEKPDWLLLTDTDGFMEAPSGTLREAIDAQDREGNNLIQFDTFEFWPTPLDPPVKDVRQRFRYYSWHDRFHFRAWKHGPGIRIHPSGGHMPIFPKGMKVNLSPRRFIVRHYPIRGYDQGRRKVAERLDRYSEFDKGLFKMKKYSNYRDDSSYFIIDPARLNRYEEDGKWIEDRKFVGWRTHVFPNLRTSEEVRKEMDAIADQYDRFCVD